MKKVLVPADFSVNSKSGVRFAIHWATRQKLELVFVHVLYILRATRWSDSYFAKYADQEENLCRTKFEKFIAAIYKKMKVTPGKYSCIIVQGISADITILDYCGENPAIDCICISTRGAGKFKKIFGTNTGNLITKSAIPVLAVPKKYKTTDVKRVLYATDFCNYREEIKKVVAFAQPLKAAIEVIHFTGLKKSEFDKKAISPDLKTKFKYGLKVHIVKTDTTPSLSQNLQNQVRKRKPSVVIMFTEQKKTFLQKIFLSSQSEKLSFQAKVPLLVFNKN